MPALHRARPAAIRDAIGSPICLRSRAAVLGLLLVAACAHGATITGTVKTSMGFNPSGAVTIKASSGASTTTVSPTWSTYSLAVPDGWSGYLVASFKPGPAYLVNVPAYHTITNASGSLVRDFTLTVGQVENLSGTVTNSAGVGISNVLVYASAGTGGGMITEANGTYVLGVLGVGAPSTWTGTMTPLAPDRVFSPSQRVYSAALTPITGCDFAVAAGSALGLSLTKSASASVVRAGDPVEFTLLATNSAPGVASNVVVRDTLSTRLAFASAGGGGTYDGETRTVSWALGTLGPGAGTAVTFSATVESGLAPGATITNVARISAEPGGTNDSNAVTLQGALPPAATNRLVFCRNQSGDDWDIWLMDLDGGNPVAVLDDAYASRTPRFSPDGARICFVRMFTGGSNDIFAMDADGTGITNLTAGSAVAGRAMAPRFSWDGARICFDVAASQTNHDLWVMGADGSGKAPVLDDAHDDSTPSFSPDGLWLAFQRLTAMEPVPLGPICKVRISDGYVTNLTTGAELDEMPVFSPDGQSVIYKHGTSTPEIYRCPADYDCADTNQLVNLTRSATRADDSPACSWEGDRIAYMANTGAVNATEIWIMNADGSGQQQLTANSQKDYDPSFAPCIDVVRLGLTKSADAATVRGGDVVTFTLVLTNSSALTASNAVVTDRLSPWLADGVTPDGGGVYDAGTRTITWTPGDLAGHAGTSLAFSAAVGAGLAAGQAITNTAEVACTQTGTNASNAVTLTGALPSVAIGKLVFSRHTSMTNWKLVMMDADGGNETDLTSGAWMDGLPHFKPDGSQIAFARITNRMQLAAMDVYAINADGTGETNLTAGIGDGCNSPRFSWDGAQICFDRTATPGNGDLYRMKSDGTGITPVLTTGADDASPCFSPDGEWIVFQRKTAEDPNPKSIIAKVRIADSNVVALTDGSDVDETPMWSPDGQTIIFKRGYTEWDLFAMPADHDPASSDDLVNLTQTSTRSIGAAMYAWEQTCIYLQSTVSGVDPDAAEIFRINPDGSGRTQLTDNAVADWDPAPSPVGLWITPSAGANGSISPAAPVRVFYNAATSFLVAASNYYHIGSIQTNGSAAAGAGGASTNFVWSGIRSSGTVHAAFAENLATNDTPEWWLAQYYPDTNDFHAAALSDTDGDGHAAWQEYPAGTDPTNGGSVLRFVQVAGSGQSGGVVIRWQSASNRHYRVDRGTDLATVPAFPFPVCSNIPAVWPMNTETDKTATGTGPFYYRVGVE